jgi:hypothetical protein
MPISWTALFRVVVMLLMAAHVFYFYEFARNDLETVGLEFTTVLASSSFGLVMLVPLAWAAALPDLPLIIRTQVGRRRWQRGCCAWCGRFLLAAAGTVCPECGEERRPPPAFELGWGTVRRFAILALAAWVIGCVAAESWASLDEMTFAREAPQASRAGGSYSRQRRWPMQDKRLYYTAADGVTAYAPHLVLPEPVGPQG